jgi:hypothetical protein
MSQYADLEIGLEHRGEKGYEVDLRYTGPGDDTVNRLVKHAPSLKLDTDSLRKYHLKDEDYGQTLAQQLFGQAEIREAFNKARANAQRQEAPLRVRLFLDPRAHELHSLRWETLRDPDDPDSTLLTSEHYYFSRYLSSYDWGPVYPRAKSKLKALVAIANPADLDPDQLAPVDVEGELARARAGMGEIKTAALARVEDRSHFENVDFLGTATLNQIQDSLREGYDVLYLVCHGALEKDGAQLWLEDEEGKAHVVSGRELATRLNELQHRPRLVVLASCQSAGSGDQPRSDDGGALAALGPRLAEAGVPAVLAMQGNITMQTVENFMPVFFGELGADGQIDRAVALARGAVRDRPDWWMPVLFMRLKSGRLWYTPGFAEDQAEAVRWPALLRHIEGERCTPIIGLGAVEWLLGSSRQIAQRWAETYNFPMAPHEREDMPQVAQYLAVNQDRMFPRDELLDHVKRELLLRYGDTVPDDFQDAELDVLLAEVGRLHREKDPADPHRVLAELDLPIYISTTPGNLLEAALRAAGKEPVCEICRWNKDLEGLASVFEIEPGYRPTPQRPLVYHLFGRLQEPDSLVLTEDDYFDFLIGVTENKDLIPGVVRKALVNSALMFLGFRLDEWDFRVLFRSIMQRGGSFRRSRFAHVAVQISPEEVIEPARARRYLEGYFQEADINIYWGSAENFIKELKEQMGGRS